MERMEHSDPPPAGPTTKMGRIESRVAGARAAINRLDRRISSSTFGRIFHLHGSGHVRNLCPPSPTLVEQTSLTPHASPASRDPKCHLLQGDACRHHHVRHHGLYHRREREIASFSPN